MKRVVCLSCCFILLAVNLTFQSAFSSDQKDQIALEEVIVTATRTKEPLERLSSSVTVITAQQIQAQHANNVLEVLRNVPGVYISQTGTLGKAASAFLRGGESRHTLLMIDGVQINSPTLGSADLADLTVDNVDRLEIVRGAQSTLYGSDAIAGVINIITKTGSGKPKYDFSAEAGSFNTFTEKAALSGSVGKIGYAIALSRTDTNGLDNFNVPVYSKSEESVIVDKWVNKKYGNDKYNNNLLSGRVSYSITDQINFQSTFHFHSSEAGIPGQLFLDKAGQIAKDYDKNASQNASGGIFLLEFGQQLYKGWEHKLKASFVKDSSKFDDDLDPGQDPKLAWVTKNKIDTDISTVDWQHTIRLSQLTDLPESVDNTSILGVEFEKQTASNFDELQKQSQFDESVESVTNIAGYAQNQIGLWNRFFVTAGIRGDRHTTFGTSVNPKLSASYLLKETKTKLKGSWGTGFHAPTFNDLYFPGYGNKDVKPEESHTFEAGIEQKLFKDRLHLGATYFQNKFKNLIAFKITDPKTFAGQAANIKQAESKGWEFESSLSAFRGLMIFGSYTFLEAKDTSEEQAQPLRRRPKHSGRINLNYEPDFKPLSERLNLNLDIVAVGKLPDADIESGKILQYPGYTKVDLAAAVKIVASIRAFAKASNLFDVDYQEVVGYPSYGSHFTGGIIGTF